MPSVASTLPELLPAWTFTFLLLVCRIGAALLLLPALGEQELPGQVKAALALALSALLWPVVEPALPPPPGDAARAVALVAGECAIGLWFGLLARTVALALPMAAQYLGLLLGLSTAALFDPSFGAAGTALSRLMGLGGVVVLFATGLHVLPISALAGSYRVLPAGAGFPADGAVELLVTTAAASIALAFQLAGPFVLASVVFQLALGLLSRLVPQMQVYFVALPLQLFGGLALLGALTAGLVAVWTAAAQTLLGGLPGL
ncbi:MAG: flagellar biosynthetic protein FliR [Acetobacteraceae bacterium]